MGVSFKISKTGSRYRQKLPHPPDPVTASGGSAATRDGGGDVSIPKEKDREVALLGLGDGFADLLVSSANCESNHAGLEHQASFALNLFPDGFSVGKPTEGMLLPLLEDVPKLLHPYNRASMTLFSAIEYGWLPGDIFDDIPCKYYNGTLICEVWDYRTCLSKLGNNDSSGDEFPKVQKVCLRMGMENVVKDMLSISDNSWNYNDLLQVESRITKALQPELFLSPNPSLDRLCRTPFPKQLDLGIYNGRLTRKQQEVPELNLKSTDLSYGRDISNNGCFDSLKPQPCVGDGTFCSAQYAISTSIPYVQQNDITNNVSEQALQVAFRPNYNSAVSCSFSAPNNAAITNSLLPLDQNTGDSSIGLRDSAFLLGKRNTYKLQLVPEPTVKKPKQETPDPNYCQFSLSPRDSLFEKELQRNITLLQKQQETQSMQHPRIVDQSYHSETNAAIMERVSKLEVQMSSPLYQGGQCSVKQTLPETKILSKPEVEKDKEDHKLDVESDKSNQQQPLSLIRSLPPQMQWSSTGPSIEKYPKKSTSRKRKLTQRGLVSAGDSVHYPVSNLGENKRTSSGAPYRTCPDVASLGCHMDKAASAPAASIGNASVNSGISNSLVQVIQMPPHTKKPKALNKVTSQSMSCIGSSAPVSDTNVQLCSNSFSVGAPLVQPLSGIIGDSPILERLSRVDMVTKRHGLNNKKSTADKYLTSKSLSHFPLPPTNLLKPEDTEECRPLTEKMCLSKYLVGGSRNICKTRIMTFVRMRYFLRGNGIPVLVIDSWIKLILFESEKPDDHKIGAEVIFGEEDSIPIALLPSPHHADLFAAQFTSLMEREGYELKNDQIQPTHACTTDASSSNSVHVGSSGVAELSSVTPSIVRSLKAVTSIGSGISILNPHHQLPQSIPTPTRMPPSFFNLTRPQQLDIVAHCSSMQQQHSRNQSSLLVVRDNSLGNSNMQMGSQLQNYSTSLQLLHLQQYQQQQHQQQAVLQCKMSSLGATSNGIAMGGHVSGLNVSQIGDNLWHISGFGQSGNQFINRGDSQAQATRRVKPRQANIQGIGVMDGIPIKTSADGIVGISGDGPLLDQTQGRSCIGQFQYTDKVRMGLSNVPSVNLHSQNYGQLKQGQIHQGKLHHPLQWQQREKLGSPQKHSSPLITQMSQSTPMSPKEPSSGSAPQQVNAGIANKCSPQLSSQTAGSGGSITSSPMELQGILKGGSGSNAAFGDKQ